MNQKIAELSRFLQSTGSYIRSASEKCESTQRARGWWAATITLERQTGDDIWLYDIIEATRTFD